MLCYEGDVEKTFGNNFRRIFPIVAVRGMLLNFVSTILPWYVIWFRGFLSTLSSMIFLGLLSEVLL
jgi:hypothetical protein